MSDHALNRSELPRRKIQELIEGLRQEMAGLEDVARRVDAGEMTLAELDELLRSYEVPVTAEQEALPPLDWRTMPPPAGPPVADREESAWSEPARTSADRLPAPEPVRTAPVTAREPLRTSTVISLIGAFLIGAAALIFAAVAWKDLGTAARLGVLGTMAGVAFGGTLFAHRKNYQGTAEGMAWITSTVVSVTTGTATFYDVLPGLPGLQRESGILTNASIVLVAACLLLSRLTPVDASEKVSLLRQPRQLLPFAILAFAVPLLYEGAWKMSVGTALDDVVAGSALLLIALAFLAAPRREVPRVWRIAAVVPGVLASIEIVFAALSTTGNLASGSLLAFVTGAAGMLALYKRREISGVGAFQLFSKFVIPAVFVYAPLQIVSHAEKTAGLPMLTLAAFLALGAGLIAWMRQSDRTVEHGTPGFVRAGQVFVDLGVPSLRRIPHLMAMLPAAAGWCALLATTDVLLAPSSASLPTVAFGGALAVSVYAGHRIKFSSVRETLPSLEPTLPFTSASLLLTLFVAARYVGLDTSWSFFTLFASAALMLVVYVLFHRGVPSFSPSASLYPLVADREDGAGPRVDGTFAVLLAAAAIGAGVQTGSPAARTVASAVVLFVCGVLVSRGARAALPVAAAALMVTAGLSLDLGGVAPSWNFVSLFLLSSSLLAVQVARKPEGTGAPGAITLVYLFASAASAFVSTGRPDTRTYVCAVASVLSWFLVLRGVRVVMTFAFTAALLLLASALHWAGLPGAWIGLVLFVAGGALAGLASARPQLVGRGVSTPHGTIDGVLLVAMAAAGAGAILSLLGEAPRTITAGMATMVLIVGAVRGVKGPRIVVAATVLANLTWFFAAVWADITNPDVLGAVSGVVSLLGASVVLHVEPRSRSWVLAPGMVGLLGYSVLETQNDPSNLTRWTVSLVGGCVFAVYGLARRFKTPFLVGLSVLVLTVLSQVGPWALDVPRWILLLVIGVTLMVGGAKFEKVKSGYGVAEHFIQRMR